MAPSRKQQVIDLLKSLETKNPAPFAYVNPNKYIQHNLQVGPGPEGVAALIQKMPPDASVNTIRVFEDGDYVIAHTEYNFFGPRIGFDIFRFEDGLIVEHWDNLQETATELSPSGHTMIDGPTAVSDLDQTQANKALMQRYMDDLLAGRRETFPSYFNGIAYIQHNPWVADTIPGLIAGLQALAAKGRAVVYPHPPTLPMSSRMHYFPNRRPPDHRIALLRVSHVFHPREGLIPSTRPAEFHYR